MCYFNFVCKSLFIKVSIWFIIFYCFTFKLLYYYEKFLTTTFHHCNMMVVVWCIDMLYVVIFVDWAGTQYITHSFTIREADILMRRFSRLNIWLPTAIMILGVGFVLSSQAWQVTATGESVVAPSDTTIVSNSTNFHSDSMAITCPRRVIPPSIRQRVVFVLLRIHRLNRHDLPPWWPAKMPWADGLPRNQWLVLTDVVYSKHGDKEFIRVMHSVVCHHLMVLCLPN